MRFEPAIAYIRHRLETELPDKLYYHGAHHTRDDVVPAAERLSDAHDLEPEERELLLTAAWLHDIGFVVKYTDNEITAVEMAREHLPEFDYTPDQIEVIGDIILATELDREPNSLLEQIMVDADMDSLGRDDLFQVGDNLRREEALHRQITRTDEEWYRQEITFLRSHRYYTLPQQRLRNPGKVRNFLMFYRLLLAEQAVIRLPNTG